MDVDDLDDGASRGGSVGIVSVGEDGVAEPPLDSEEDWDSYWKNDNAERRAVRIRVASERFPSEWENDDGSLKPVGNNGRCLLYRRLEIFRHYQVRYTFQEESYEGVQHSDDLCCVPPHLRSLLEETYMTEMCCDELDYALYGAGWSGPKAHDRLQLPIDPEGYFLPPYWPIVTYEQGCVPRSAAGWAALIVRHTDKKPEAVSFVLDRTESNVALRELDWGEQEGLPKVVPCPWGWSKDDEQAFQLERARLNSDYTSTEWRDAQRYRELFGREPQSMSGYYFHRVV